VMQMSELSYTGVNRRTSVMLS